MNYTLEIYRMMLTSIRRGRAKVGFSKAKPLFLITLLDFVPFCDRNQIKFGDSTFVDLYNTNREFYAKDCTTSYEVPFYHLNSEPFYNLIWKDSNAASLIKHTPTAKFLREHLLYARVDDELWEVLQDEGNRAVLKDAIIKQYLNDQSN